MGNTVGTPIVSEYLEDEVGPIVCQNSLGNTSRFLKTVKAYHEEEGYVVVKIYKKRYIRENLGDKYLKPLNEIKESFNVTNTTYNYFNIMPYQLFLETDRSGYLIRQYFHNNLYDRISTRPFLSMIEKKFFTFQLLHALDQCFFRGIHHGDIKCENVMVTTTNWLYLTDFACYKPTFIPEDNPSDFSFYFDTSGRRTCYIAPERFYETNKGMPQGQDLNIKMDIFSLGCVIAEIFLEGVPIFDFSQLLSYRKGEYSPEPIIRRIPDPHIQSLILHMIQKEPDQRFSPVKYLENWKNKAFPVYFDFAHQFISESMKLDNDDRILCLSDKFDEIIQVFTGSNNNNSSPILQSTKQQQLSIPNSPITKTNNNNILSQSNSGNGSSNNLKSNLTSTSNLVPNPNTNISNIILNTENYIKDQEKFDNIDLNNFNLDELNIDQNVNKKKQQLNELPTTTINTSTSTLPLNNNNSITNNIDQQQQQQPTIIEGLDIFLSLIYSALKYCKYSQTKIKCVGSLFERFAQYLDDECKLQKIVPYLVSMIMSTHSSSANTNAVVVAATSSTSINGGGHSTSSTLSQPSLVRVEALRTLAKVLEMVQNFPPSESQIFSQYILPSLSQLSNEQTEEIVRIAYAEVLPQLATTAKRYLEISQRFRDPDQLRKDNNNNMSSSSSNIGAKDNSSSTRYSSKNRGYDAELNEIQDIFLSKVSDLLTKDSCLTLKRIILSDIYRLCVFFGRQKTNESVLPLIITFLNDKDWQLRCAFFENIVAVCTVVGAGSLESFIYPCILLALADEEEFVTEKALASLSELCSLGLLRKNILLELLIKTSPMLLHPNNWIRYGVISLIIKICSSLSRADLHCYAKPKLSMYLQGEISDHSINENSLFHLLESPISRDSFNKIVKLIYKNQITLQSALHSNNTNNNDIDDDIENNSNNNLANSSGLSSQKMSNLGTGGSYRRLRALSQKLYPVNGSIGSSGGGALMNSSGGSNNSSSSGGGNILSNTMSLSRMDEQQQDFLAKMNELKIVPEDQEKIFKCLDYLLLKKYKDEDQQSNQYGSGGQIPSVTVTSNNQIIRQSIAKSSNINYINNYNSSQQLQQQLNAEIIRLPNVPIRICKMRSIDPSSSITNLTGGLNVSSSSMSSSTTSLPQLNISQSNQLLAATLSTSNPVISSSNSNLSTISSTNSLPNNLNQQQQQQQNTNNINTNTTNNNISSGFNNYYSNHNNNQNNDSTIVNQMELNVQTKKFKILSKEKLQLHDILKVEVQTDCFIYTSPPLPDLGTIDQSSYTGLSPLNNNNNNNNNTISGGINNNIGLNSGGGGTSNNSNISGTNINSSSNSNLNNNINNINNNNSSLNANNNNNNTNLNSGINNPNNMNQNNNQNINMNSSSILYNNSSSSQLPQWKPQGILVGHFFEHKAAVNQIQVSSDNLFFATASNDGYVKIWDCQRMEKSVTNKSRQTYNQDGGRIISIAICEKTHSIASASDKGSIHVFKVGIGGKQKSGNLKYTGFSSVKQIQEQDGNIVAVDHYQTNSQSIVIYATSRGGVKGWDLRSQQQAFSLSCEPSLGLVQAFLIDPNRNWFITATSRGFITCWDLRFKIPIYNHRVTNGRIFNMVPYLGGLRSSIETSWIYISTEMDNVILFDLASKNIRRVFKRSFSDSSSSNSINTTTTTTSTSSIISNSGSITPNSSISSNSNTIVQQYQTTNSSSSSYLNNVIDTSLSNYDLGTDNMIPIPKNSILPTPSLNGLNIQSISVTPSSMLSVPINTSPEKKMPTIRALLAPINSTYLITAGDDKRIKYWEGKDVSGSYYISSGKETPPPYTHKYSNDTTLGLETFEEVWCDTSQSSFYSNSIQSSTSSALQQRQKQKSTTISTPTIHHQEPILDLKIMEVPNPMLISASTDGIVKVWK